MSALPRYRARVGLLLFLVPAVVAMCAETVQPNFYLPEKRKAAPKGATAKTAALSKQVSATKARAARSKAVAPRKTSADASAAATSATKVRATRPVLALDPYQLCAYVVDQWDLLSFLPSPEKMAEYEADARVAKAKLLSSRLQIVSDRLRQSQLQVYNTALAAYALGAAAEKGDGPDDTVSVNRRLAFRIMLRQQATAASGMMAQYSQLREGSNRALSEIRASDTSGVVESNGYSITVSNSDRARELTRAMLEVHSLTPDLIQVLDTAERIRKAKVLPLLASLAPAPPSPLPHVVPAYVALDTPIPAELPPSRKRTPDVEPLPKRQVMQTVLAAPTGTVVRSAASGKVLVSGNSPSLGGVAIIQHGESLFSVYGYLSSSVVKVGDSVTTGQEIGRVGRSGPARSGVLFEVCRATQSVDPKELLGSIDPKSLILGR